MASGIGTAILFYCIQYMSHEKEGTTRFYGLMLTFITGLICLVFSENLLAVYISWELIGLCSYFLVGFWYKQEAAVQGARKVLVMTHLPGYGLLIAILMLYHQTGTLLWTDPTIGAAFSTGIFLLVLLAAMAKSVLFPLHTWIPEAMNAPTPVSALLHSACYVKAGVYLVARMYSITTWNPAWNQIVLVIGCITIFVGAVFALVQTDLKRMLAYSTISQLGYIITGLGLGTNLGLAAGLFYCMSHGLFKGTLFLCAGAVQHATGTREMRSLGGLAKKMPGTAAIWFIAAAAIIGVPLTNGFVAKWLILDAALEANALFVVVVAWVVSVFTAFYMLKATVSTFYGEEPAELKVKEIHDAEPTMLIGMGVLGGLCILFGVAPQLLMNAVIEPAVKSLNAAWEMQVAWLGIQTQSAGLNVSMAAGVLVVLSVLIGLVVLALSRKTANRQETVNLFTGGDPLPEDADVSVQDFAALAETAFTPIYQFTDPDRLYFPIWRGMKTAADSLNKGARAGVEKHAILASAVLVAIIIGLAAFA
jgi:proton-translocating NADH-quinone oxidoreductase chain N